MAKAHSYLPQPPEAKAASTHHWRSTECEEKYPAIFSLLSIAKVNGEDRQGATITIFADQGKLKASVCDRHTDQSMFASLDSLVGLWEALESFIVSHPSDWRERTEKNNGRVRRP